jgi:hypothetical protein
MMTAEELRERLDYDPETGVFTWRRSESTRVKIGGVAGTYTEKGYVRVRVLGRPYRAHRLAWLYVRGVWPQDQIDHINGIRDDNRIENLREATNAENQRNMKKRAGKRCALKGVHVANGRFRAVITVAYKRFYLGNYNTEEEAHAAYVAAAEKEFGAFARAE